MSKSLLLVIYDAKNAVIACTHDLVCHKKIQGLFFILHDLSPVIHANVKIAVFVLTKAVFVLLRTFRFSLYCYSQPEPKPTQKSAQSGSCGDSPLPDS